MKNLIRCLLFSLPFFLNVAKAQNVAINTDGSTPDASAMLDIKSTTKGLLAPRMTTTQQNAISSPATGLLVFNTTDNLFRVNTGTPASPVWTALSAATNNWLLTGNGGSSSATNFLGTTDNVSMRFRTNNLQRMVIDSLGSVGIGTPTFNATNPEKLLVDAGTTTSVNAIVGKGTIDSYLQLNIQNNSSGTSASSDVVATANNGSETTNYVDMGINGGSNASNVMGVANDAYLYNIGQNLLVGTGSASKSVVFMTGGTSQASNERMRIDGSGNVGIGVTSPSYKLQVSAASNPLQLTGLQTGSNTDSILTVSSGVVRRLNVSALTTSSSNAWALVGNAGTNPSTHFVGTTDNQSLVFKANNQLSGKIDVSSNNTMFGYQAGQAIASGSNNTFTGYQAGYSTNSGTGNAALGYSALKNNLSGNNNTALGINAGITNANGDNNTFIGNGADATTGNLSNASAIGKNAKVASSNSMVLGGTGADAVNVAIGTTSFNGSNPEKLVVDAGTTTSVNAIVGKGSINSYLQLNIQNNSSGTNASSDVVATANNGDETTNYVDMGINGGSNTSGVMGAANDGYLYTMGNNFLIGTGNASKSLVFMTGGTIQSTNERMRIDGTGNVGIGNTAPGQKLDVTGNMKLSGAFMPNNAAGTSGYLLQSAGAGAPPTWIDPMTIASSGWALNGNSVTAVKNFGTTSNYSLPFITNNTEKMRLTTAGYLGL